MAFSEQLLMDRVNVVDAGEARREKRAQQCGSWHGHAAHVRYGLACGVTVRDRSQHGACASRRVRRSHRQACGAPCLGRDVKFADGPYGRGGRSPQGNRRSTYVLHKMQSLEAFDPEWSPGVARVEAAAASRSVPKLIRAGNQLIKCAEKWPH